MAEQGAVDAMAVEAAGTTTTELQDQSSMLDELMSSMAELEQHGRSHDYALHDKNIRLCKQLGPEMADMLDTAREMLASAFPLGDGVWLEWVQDKEAIYATERSVEAAQAVLDLYERASQDYASVPIQQARLRFVTSQHHLVRGFAPPRELLEDDDEGTMDAEPSTTTANDELAGFFTDELVRDTAADGLASVGYNLAESALAWSVLCAWELSLLRRDPSPQQIAEVQAMFEGRLAVPHQGSASTFAAFSRFTTSHNNAHYEQALVAAQKVYAPAEEKMSEREVKELALVQSGHSQSAFQEYIGWELKVKKPDIVLVLALYERAVKLHFGDPDLWTDYLRFANSHSTSSEAPIDVARRAVRNVPWSGEAWASAIMVFERRLQPLEEIEALCAQAVATGLLDNNVDHLVSFVTGRAGYHRRRLETYLDNGGDDAAQVEALVGAVEQVLKDGLERTKRADKQGDPACRLEKYLVSFLEGNDREDEAVKIWQKAVKQHRNSSSVWLAAAETETRRGDFAAARDLYSKAASAKLDYPEYLLQAWIQFENHHGGLADVEMASNRVRGLMRGINARRQREAAAAAQTSGVEQQTLVPSASTGAPAVANESASRKRPAEEDSPVAAGGEQEAKRPKTDHAPPKELKRDREHCTVLVSGLASTHKEEDIRRLFADCGETREITLQDLGPNGVVATVEFIERESVLPALTKDKKRIDGQEVEVYLAWQSTLYVTNYPASMDDAAMKELFSQFGTVLDVRWPSKRFKSTRRFCYVQFVLPRFAQAALELHGRELEPGMALNVLVSDPERRKERTDARTNERELYITGLSRFAKESDLQRLFSRHGEIKGIRMITDDEGFSKGFAFVEFAAEESAQAALSLNNHELRKRRIGVTISSGRAAAQPPLKGSQIPEARARSVWVSDLPEGTQEAIVQQAFDRHGKVKQVLTRAEQHAAIVEFETQQDAGRVLLLTEPVEIKGQAVQISPMRDRATAGQGSVAASSSTPGSAPPSFVPRTAAPGRGRARGRLGLGMKGRGGGIVSQSRPAETVEPTPNGAGGRSQDDFRSMLNK